MSACCMIQGEGGGGGGSRGGGGAPVKGLRDSIITNVLTHVTLQSHS